MRLCRLFCLAFPFLVALSTPLGAQTVVPSVTALRSGSFGPNVSVTLSSYYLSQTGGGGVLYSDGTADCAFGGNGTVSSGTPTVITVSSDSLNWAKVALTMQVTSSLLGITNDPVVSFTAQVGSTLGTITLMYAATSPGSHLLFTLNGDNGGTSFVDAGGDCFHRVSQTYSQVEWGAYGDCCSSTSHNDYQALQNWLNANQPHIAVPGNSLLLQGLTCSNPNGFSNYNGAIQGPPPVGVSAAGQQPSFIITAGDASGIAGDTFSGPAMLTMTVSPCAISGGGLIGSNSTTAYDIIDAEAPHNSVFNHSQLSGGNVGFNCVGAGADMEIEDSSIVSAAAAGISSGCANMKIMRNVISANGGDGIFVSGSEILIEGNVIEQSGGNGIKCSGGLQIAVVGNYIDGNGKTKQGTSNARLHGCQLVSIVGNQFKRGSANDQQAEAAGGSTPTAHIWLENANDSISLSGNTYFTGNDNNATVMRPDYDIELTAGASVTNFSFSDSPTPQSALAEQGVFGPSAAASLAAFLAPQTQQNYLTGLITANVSGSPKLTINPGAAADSSNAQLINQPSSCTVDLSEQGVGGLDNESTYASNTQYNFFVFAQGGYASGAKCIASTALVPDFVTAGAPAAAMYGFLTLNSYAVTNVTNAQCTVSGGNITSCPHQNPFGGLAAGDYMMDSAGNIPGGTTIRALTSLNVRPFQATLYANEPYVSMTAVPTNLYVGEVVGNCTANNADTACGSGPFSNWINGYAVIQSIVTSGSCATGVSAPCFVMSTPANVGGTVYLTASGAYTITMSNKALGSTSGSGPGDTLAVYNDRYRMVAAMYTDGSKNVEGFTQDGDTFYLKRPANDVASVSVGTGQEDITLASVPNLIPVEALGRCVATSATAGNAVMVFTPPTVPNTPTGFSTAPGYTFTTTAASGSPTATTAYPYRLYTNTLQQIAAQASAASTLQCMTDGWVWNRGK